jgi:transcriptional regulator with XRE-family HTH domain
MRQFKHYGLLMREWRLVFLDMSQAELAKKLNIHVQYISNIERGLCQYPVGKLRKLVKLIKKDMEYWDYDLRGAIRDDQEIERENFIKQIL